MPKVVIVDDIELNIVMLDAMVRRHNACETVRFTSASAALDWCRETAPDLILLDYMMPEMDGAAFLTELRRIDHCRMVPTLVITSEQDRATLLRALDAGANDFVRKPVDPVEFQARVRNALQFAAALGQLRHLATTDALTGLANRRTFMRQLDDEHDRARRYGQTFSVALLDVDHFKQVNDRHGHAAGDTALIAIAAACQTALRKPDTIGRLGGEEFAVIMPGTSLAGAQLAGERLRAAVAALALDPVGAAGSLTISIGVAEFGPGRGAEALLGRADAALYDAKAAGRNRVVRAA